MACGCNPIWHRGHSPTGTDFSQKSNKGGHQYKKVTKLRTFSVWGGGAQPHSIAFGGIFPNITKAILVDEISTKKDPHKCP